MGLLVSSVVGVDRSSDIWREIDVGGVARQLVWDRWEGGATGAVSSSQTELLVGITLQQLPYSLKRLEIRLVTQGTDSYSILIQCMGIIRKANTFTHRRSRRRHRLRRSARLSCDVLAF